ncbi:hypothetical protein GCM10012275_51910 [Longimycelium tulufanense]|uniref:Uncharacterized protein n=1 Tax=Longimycelium tulufanense TaxID=907463 RepID=A0A8J3CH69_9PSEU|nr:hypothetical protein GCM10012275_51910 [Longimycelium tulufanense]
MFSGAVREAPQPNPKIPAAGEARARRGSGGVSPGWGVGAPPPQNTTERPRLAVSASTLHLISEWSAPGEVGADHGQPDLLVTGRGRDRWEARPGTPRRAPWRPRSGGARNGTRVSPLPGVPHRKGWGHYWMERTLPANQRPARLRLNVTGPVAPCRAPLPPRDRRFANSVLDGEVRTFHFGIR